MNRKDVRANRKKRRECARKHKEWHVNKDSYGWVCSLCGMDIAR